MQSAYKILSAFLSVDVNMLQCWKLFTGYMHFLGNSLNINYTLYLV
jgi:hypothetical protein